MRESPFAGRPTHEAPGKWFWLLMAVSLVVVGGVAYLQYSRFDQARRGTPVAQLPALAVVPDFALTERSGRQVTSKDLRGHVWVADFIFASCGGPCPVMTRRMRQLQMELLRDHMDSVRCVSITVDPQRDTPEVLRGYAGQYSAQRETWLFLTGDKQKIRDLVVSGFKLGLSGDGVGPEPILHSTRFVLVDRRGQIRGYYRVLTNEEEDDIGSIPPERGMPPDEKKRLMLDIQSLLREGGR